VALVLTPSRTDLGDCGASSQALLISGRSSVSVATPRESNCFSFGTHVTAMRPIDGTPEEKRRRRAKACIRVDEASR
jgi:hypothetical protein